MGFWGIVNGVKDGITSAANKVGGAISSYANNVVDHFSSGDLIGGAMSLNGLGDLWDNWSGTTANKQYEQNRQDALNQYQEQFDYLKEQNQLAMERADTAYQRSAADMYAAGLNPLSSNIQAADVGTKGGNIQEMTATPTASSGAGGLGDILGLASPILGFVNQRQAQQNQIMFQNAQLEEAHRHNLALEANQAMGIQNTKQANDQRKEEFNEQAPVRTQSIATQNAQQKVLEAQAADQQYETNYKKQHGISDISTNPTKQVAETGGIIEKGTKLLHETKEKIDTWQYNNMKNHFEKIYNSLSPEGKKKLGNFYTNYNLWQKAQKEYPSFDAYINAVMENLKIK